MSGSTEKFVNVHEGKGPSQRWTKPMAPQKTMGAKLSNQDLTNAAKAPGPGAYKVTGGIGQLSGTKSSVPKSSFGKEKRMGVSTSGSLSNPGRVPRFPPPHPAGAVFGVACGRCVWRRMPTGQARSMSPCACAFVWLLLRQARPLPLELGPRQAGVVGQAELGGELALGPVTCAVFTCPSGGWG